MLAQQVITSHLEIPDKIISGEVDVMITDNVETYACRSKPSGALGCGSR